MKQGIHPEYHPAAFIDVSTGRKFLTRSTIKTGQTETVDGVDYVKVFRDITMDSHPVYTGEKRFVDTAGRVEKFQNKFRRSRG
ncbi:MAG: type B 50S ribosomal protein L31 [Opitutales bacterium]|nr:type B 50S ribosomal protein L31 [Opitutales bacterium]MDG2255558.1 type B 50S ribosomal protein L31 [Opitutaceae bacterium]MBT5168217.1 type B 50S ribosomal protein L31 [Opitutales bacterium]MBT5815549.1 type B 50S ribosomal protein L31 [Opitutales bacterium]MBT6381486.1 type B 50S ribosomal protein L31 [Opitutales bacterium]